MGHEYEDRYEDEYDDEGGAQILWGRVAFFVVVAALLFFVGRFTAPTGVPESEVAGRDDQIRNLAEEVALLEQQLSAFEQGQPDQPAPAEAPGPDGQQAPQPPAEGQGEAATYTVQAGDTGHAIAEQVYGDRQLWPLIAEANGLDGDNVLRVDQELVIPPPPD